MSQAQILSFPSPTVSLINGRPATTSLEVAKFFGKRHDSVLRDVRGMLKDVPVEMGVHNFVETPYTDEQNGQTYPMFTLYRDGFMLLVMGYTGKKAMQVKITYIMAFNAMEAQISGNALPQLPLDISTTADRKPLEKLVKVWASQSGIPHAQAWTQVNAHFNLGSITELPTHWLPDAISFVEGKIDGLPKALPAESAKWQEYRKACHQDDLELAIKCFHVLNLEISAKCDFANKILKARLETLESQGV